MAAGVEADLRPIQRHFAHLPRAHLSRGQPDLNEQSCARFQNRRPNTAILWRPK